ncbi:hypothetical protein BJ875DRAFT_294351 [Amylocarpus encephaloides]|uniref:Uncharacterized protein n=1 Tax=Amylocarpus encephaloides TaxID=45428 RepID=A0A9P7YJ42_9HELO|nr:hypothetical protein BJ875DRAFT_294351 [Amylocarpus encephaloides]
MFSFNPSAYRVKRLLFAALVLATCTLFWYQFDIIREHAGLSGETTWVPKLSGHKSGAPAASNSHAQSVLGPTTTHVPVFLGATSAVVTPASAESSTLSTETTVSVKGAVSSTETPTSIVTVMESAQFTSTATKEGKPTGTPSDPLQRTNKGTFHAWT